MKANHKNNMHDTRESWLRSATAALRLYFKSYRVCDPGQHSFCDCFSVNGAARGANWRMLAIRLRPMMATLKSSFRADIADPVEALGVLVHELIHAVLPVKMPVTASCTRKRQSRSALKASCVTPCRATFSQPRLVELALLRLPAHAKLNIDRGLRQPASR